MRKINEELLGEDEEGDRRLVVLDARGDWIGWKGCCCWCCCNGETCIDGLAEDEAIIGASVSLLLFPWIGWKG